MLVGKLFDLFQVCIIDGFFVYVMYINVSYLFVMELDRLFVFYLWEVGLILKEDFYGNWENLGLDGYIGGYYLSVLSLVYVLMGDEVLLQCL